MEPTSSHVITLYAGFSASGLYCISTLKVKAGLKSVCKGKGVTLERQQWYQPYYISVEQLLQM